MTPLHQRLRHDRRGASAVEFVLLIPLLSALLLGSIQIGIMFFAYAGLRNAVAEAAREATLWPRRTQADIQARLMERRFGIDPQYMSTPVITYGSAGVQDFVEIQVSYTINMNFGAFTIPGVTLNETRRAWLP